MMDIWGSLVLRLQNCSEAISFLTSAAPASSFKDFNITLKLLLFFLSFYFFSSLTVVISWFYSTQGPKHERQHLSLPLLTSRNTSRKQFWKAKYLTAFAPICEISNTTTNFKGLFVLFSFPSTLHCAKWWNRFTIPTLPLLGGRAWKPFAKMHRIEVVHFPGFTLQLSTQKGISSYSIFLNKSLSLQWHHYSIHYLKNRAYLVIIFWHI